MFKTLQCKMWSKEADDSVLHCALCYCSPSGKFFNHDQQIVALCTALHCTAHINEDLH